MTFQWDLNYLYILKQNVFNLYNHFFFFLPYIWLINDPAISPPPTPNGEASFRACVFTFKVLFLGRFKMLLTFEMYYVPVLKRDGWLRSAY